MILGRLTPGKDVLRGSVADKPKQTCQTSDCIDCSFCMFKYLSVPSSSLTGGPIRIKPYMNIIKPTAADVLFCLRLLNVQLTLYARHPHVT